MNTKGTNKTAGVYLCDNQNFFIFSQGQVYTDESMFRGIHALVYSVTRGIYYLYNSTKQTKRTNTQIIHKQEINCATFEKKA